MPHRRTEPPPTATDKKSKVFWSQAERDDLIARAVKIQRERPDLAGLPLLREAQKVMPTDRRRDVAALTQVSWFETGVKEEARRLAAIARGEGDPTVPVLREGVEANRQNNQLISSILAEHRAWFADSRQHMGDTSQQGESQIALLALILRELQIITARLGRPDPTMDEAGKPKDEPPPLPLPSTNGHANGHASQATIKRLGLSKPRIAIVGADARESNHVSEKVGQTAQLSFLERRSPGRQLPHADFYIITRHASHEWWDRLIKEAGRDRVVRLATTGVDAIVAKVSDLARKVPTPT